MMLLTDCDGVRQLMPEYAYHGVGFWSQWQIAAHLRMCPGCGRDWEVFQQEGRLLDNLPPLRAPEGIWERIEVRLAETVEEANGGPP